MFVWIKLRIEDVGEDGDEFGEIGGLISSNNNWEFAIIEGGRSPRSTRNDKFVKTPNSLNRRQFKTNNFGVASWIPHTWLNKKTIIISRSFITGEGWDGGGGGGRKMWGRLEAAASMVFFFWGGFWDGLWCIEEENNWFRGMRDCEINGTKCNNKLNFAESGRIIRFNSLTLVHGEGSKWGAPKLLSK